MGNRANIVIEQDSDMFPHPIYFYTHYDGSEIEQILKSALIRGRDRWDDPQYLSRVIFCEMIKDDLNGVTGYGITTAIGDGGYKLLCVKMDEQKVRIRDSSDDITAKIIKEWTFEEFVRRREEENG
jgi:hypothetical protein